MHANVQRFRLRPDYVSDHNHHINAPLTYILSKPASVQLSTIFATFHIRQEFYFVVFPAECVSGAQLHNKEGYKYVTDIGPTDFGSTLPSSINPHCNNLLIDSQR
jgi:hypothetical protein